MPLTQHKPFTPCLQLQFHLWRSVLMYKLPLLFTLAVFSGFVACKRTEKAASESRIKTDKSGFQRILNKHHKPYNEGVVEVQLFVQLEESSSLELLNTLLKLKKADGMLFKYDLQFLPRTKGKKSVNTLDPVSLAAPHCAKKLNPYDLHGFARCFHAAIKSDAANGWEVCARRSRISKEKMRECAEGSEGRRMQERTARLVAQKHFTSGPALFIEGERFGGKPSLFALRKAFCDKIKGGVRPQICEAKPVKAWIIGSTLCDECAQGDRDCKTCGEIQKAAYNDLKTKWELPSVERIEHTDALARALLEKMKEKELPLLVFSPEAKTDKLLTSTFMNMKKVDSYLVVPIGKFVPHKGHRANGKGGTGAI